MTPRERKRPTDAELEILGVLWSQGPSTVREVYRTLNESREMGYTTVLKLMQIMTDKGLVHRDETRHAHVYKAAIGQKRIQRYLVGDLLAKAFDGSVHKLVVQAFSAGKVSPDEIENIRTLLEEYGSAGDDGD